MNTNQKQRSAHVARGYFEDLAKYSGYSATHPLTLVVWLGIFLSDKALTINTLSQYDTLMAIAVLGWLSLFEIWIASGYMVNLTNAALAVLLSSSIRQGDIVLSSAVITPDAVLAYAGVLLMGTVFVCIRWIHAERDREDRFEAAMTVLPYVPPPSFQQDARVQQNRTASAGNKEEGKSTNYKFVAVSARHDFSKVYGMQETKDRLLSIGQQIKREYREKGVVSNEALNGMLLTGDPGNGKTFIAEALAGELKLPFLSVGISDLGSMWVGEGPQNITKLMADAAAQAPCVLFVDEIDSIIAKRGGPGEHQDETNRVNSALTGFVNLRSKGVVLMGATNRLDNLDPAAVRPGRFDIKIDVPSPDVNARIGILKSVLNGTTYSVDDLVRVAKRWNGYSVANLRAVALEAKGSHNKARGMICFDDLYKSARKVNGTSGKRLSEDTPLLEDLVLSPQLSEELGEFLPHMMNIERADRVGAAVPYGVFFVGPPGTGKTHLAKALAKTTGWAWHTTTGAEILDDVEKFSDMIKKARSLRPSIVFIDEADDALMERGTAGMQAKTTTNRLLSLMDGTDGKYADMIFVAATNNPQFLDGAAIREGRMRTFIHFDLPGPVERKEYAKRLLSTHKARVADDVTPEWMAEAFEGEILVEMQGRLQSAWNRVSIRDDQKDRVVVRGDLVKA